jgi:hypothetical protein
MQYVVLRVLRVLRGEKLLIALGEALLIAYGLSISDNQA